jgi:hypothetical protein
MAAADVLALSHLIEGQDLQQLIYGSAAARDTTFSFWVKSNKTGTYIAWLFQGGSGRHYQAPYTIDVADTWEKKTATIPADASGAINNDNSLGLLVRFCLAAGTDWTSGTAQTAWAANTNADRFVGQTVNIADNTANYWKVTGVQLEVGDTATPFEHRSYGQELPLCQRYYYRMGDGTAFGSAQSGSGTNAYLYAYTFRHPVPMRAAPTMSLVSGGSTYFVGGMGVTIGTPTGDLGTVATSSMSIPSVNVSANAVNRLGLSGFSFTRGMGYGGLGDFINCDAEL